MWHISSNSDNTALLVAFYQAIKIKRNPKFKFWIFPSCFLKAFCGPINFRGGKKIKKLYIVTLAKQFPKEGSSPGCQVWAAASFRQPRGCSGVAVLLLSCALPSAPVHADTCCHPLWEGNKLHQPNWEASRDGVRILAISLKVLWAVVSLLLWFGCPCFFVPGKGQQDWVLPQLRALDGAAGMGTTEGPEQGELERKQISLHF